MIARVKVYAPDGVTTRTADVGYGPGILPTIGLDFSVERGGGGGCTFTALADDLTDLSARDSVIHVQVETSPGQWTSVAAYALRPPFRRSRVGFQEVECIGVSLLEAWASETVVLPEYAVGDIPRGAGTDRGVGWMSSAYVPASDPNEAWDGCYNASRSARPEGWPSGTGAHWISITGATDQSERKLFRSTVTVSSASLVRIYFSADESATVYFGGEPVINWTASETGFEDVEHFDIVCQPGTYAVACDTQSVWSTGGDGVDPIIMAICTVADDGSPDTWLLASSSSTFVACRRDDEPPDNEPPGPTPGATIDYLIDEAKERLASGWTNVTLGFSATADSYGAAWSTTVIERQVRYASDTYWAIMSMLAETDEADVWLTPSLVLHAAPAQGQTRAVTLDTADIVSMSDEYAPDEGTWVAALAMDGWITGTQGSPRREYGMEVGTALSRAVAGRVVSSALSENGRWDGSCRLAPAAPVPLVDFFVGDTIGLSYSDAPTSVQVLSVSASAGGGGLMWDLELAEVPS